MNLSFSEVLPSARAVLRAEIATLQNLERSFLATNGNQFREAIELLLQCQGKVVVSGIGKSGHIARKIASTLASTGTPAFFMHAAEALHGDLGMITENDILLAISHSGESAEFRVLAPLLQQRGIQVIAITGNPASWLANHCNIHLNNNATQEACPFGLVPTCSTTATMALGDALAITLMTLRNFRQEDFERVHPSGTLTKQSNR